MAEVITAAEAERRDIEKKKAGRVWIKVKRKNDGLVMQIPTYSFEDKHFILIDETVEERIQDARDKAKTATLIDDSKTPVTEYAPGALDEAKTSTPATAPDSPAETVVPGKYDAVPYKILREMAMDLDSALKGNPSREVCVATLNKETTE